MFYEIDGGNFLRRTTRGVRRQTPEGAMILPAPVFVGPPKDGSLGNLNVAKVMPRIDVLMEIARVYRVTADYQAVWRTAIARSDLMETSGTHGGRGQHGQADLFKLMLIQGNDGGPLLLDALEAAEAKFPAAARTRAERAGDATGFYVSGADTTAEKVDRAAEWIARGLFPESGKRNVAAEAAIHSIAVDAIIRAGVAPMMLVPTEEQEELSGDALLAELEDLGF